MPSFDVVSKLDIQEVDNAVNMVKRDIGNRYDFKGSSSSITLNKGDNNIIINADNDYQMTTIVDMLENRSISRTVSIKASFHLGVRFSKKAEIPSLASKAIMFSLITLLVYL